MRISTPKSGSGGAATYLAAATEGVRPAQETHKTPGRSSAGRAALENGIAEAGRRRGRIERVGAADAEGQARLYHAYITSAC
jgi:hypothetical protein